MKTDLVDKEKNIGNESEDRKTDWRVLRSLDAEIAERVMGWTRYPEPMHPTDNRTINGVLYCPPEYGYDSRGALNCVPYFSTDIKAAMQVVEKVRDVKTDRYWEMSDYNNGEWEVIVWRGAESLGGARSESLPEAICHAALKATECL